MRMPPGWLSAFLLALVLVVMVTPFLRRLALATDFVDQPAARKVHHDPVPYLGGLALIGGVLLGLLFEPRLAPSAIAVGLGAVVLGAVGLFDDRRNLAPGFRFVAQVGAAVVAILAGVHISATGVDALDTVITLVWLVGITNAMNLLDNMDGLAAGVAAAAGSCVFVLAILGVQPVPATMAAGLVGACLGFLVFNRHPASIFMGDSGSLFLGFVLAIITVEVDPALSPPASFAVPLMLLAIPFLDTTSVVGGRLRHGKSPAEGGKDHLSHRLVALGLSTRSAVRLLVVTEGAMGALAVAAGRAVLPLWLAVLAMVLVLGLLWAFVRRADVYRDLDVTGFPRWIVRGVLLGALGLLLMAVPALLSMARAQRPARTGAELVRAALVAADRGEAPQAARNLELAHESFRSASRQLYQPLASLGLAVPGVASNLRAARTLVDVGESLSATSGRLTSLTDARGLPVQDGTVSLDGLRRLTPLLADTATALRDAHNRLVGLDDPYLVPVLRRSVTDLGARLGPYSEAAAKAAEAVRLMPAILGGDGPRRYFLALQNNTELRGAGGLIGNWGQLDADGGRLSLARFGRLAELITPPAPQSQALQVPPEFLARYRDFGVEDTWQQVNVSPDFPSTADVIAQRYRQSGGPLVDGVIAVDPMGLAALLSLTGPVQVQGWPEPITTANVVDVSVRLAYERFPVQEERAAFLGELGRTTWDAFVHADLGSPAVIVATLNGAVVGKHLMVHLEDPQEQALVRSVGADGALPDPEQDSVTVVQQNLAGNKVDLYLQRHLAYHVVLDPNREPVQVTGTVDVTLRNGAPSEGLPVGVLGPYDDRFLAGENRTYVSVYSPFQARKALVDGAPLELADHTERGLRVASTILSIPAGQTRTLAFGVQGEVELAAGGWYRLELGHQPLLGDDVAEVSIEVAKGFRVAEVRGLERTGPRQATARGPMEGDRSMWVRVERVGWSRFWAR